MRGKTLVIGANTDPAKYAYKAAVSLLSHGHEIVLYGIKEGEVQGNKILTRFPEKIEGLETVTLYLNPVRQKEYYAKILALKPNRVLFNPGTENPEFQKMLNEAGIESPEVCTLVMLSIGQY